MLRATAYCSIRIMGSISWRAPDGRGKRFAVLKEHTVTAASLRWGIIVGQHLWSVVRDVVRWQSL